MGGKLDKEKRTLRAVLEKRLRDTVWRIENQIDETLSMLDDSSEIWVEIDKNGKMYIEWTDRYVIDEKKSDLKKGYIYLRKEGK